MQKLSSFAHMAHIRRHVLRLDGVELVGAWGSWLPAPCQDMEARASSGMELLSGYFFFLSFQPLHFTHALQAATYCRGYGPQKVQCNSRTQKLTVVQGQETEGEEKVLFFGSLSAAPDELVVKFDVGPRHHQQVRVSPCVTQHLLTIGLPMAVTGGRRRESCASMSKSAICWHSA